jgi:ribosomal protein S18 acetylase RimI-like enzyme
MRFRPATPADETRLADLFCALAIAGDERLFHPHPLTHTAARTVCRHRDAADGGPHDEYHVAVEPSARGGAETIVGYGMLRGWSEGYETPSLGIAVHPDHRGRGIARQLMDHLHAVAADRGAPRVRLKVYRHNVAAVRLYKSLAYEFEPFSETELLGFRALSPIPAVCSR